MAASDHLNGQQFLRADELGSMRSQYAHPDTGQPMTLDEAYARPDVRYNDAANRQARSRGWRDAEQQHVALRQSLRIHGQQNPIFYDREAQSVDNGHHRYFAGRDLGWDRFKVDDQTKRNADWTPVAGWDD